MKNTILDFQPEAIVIDAGQFPTAPLPLSILGSCHKIVCCDGAANRFIASGRRPWRIVGDCDSLSPELRERYADIVRPNPDQETNDQTKSVRYLYDRGLRRIAILGATGLREDHTLGNISLLIDYMQLGIQARIYTDTGLFLPACGPMELHLPVGTQVSIFNFGATGLRAEGLRYPLRDFTTWWQGTLNETTAPTVRLRATGPHLLYLLYPYPQNRSSPH